MRTKKQHGALAVLLAVLAFAVAAAWVYLTVRPAKASGVDTAAGLAYLEAQERKDPAEVDVFLRQREEQRRIEEEERRRAEEEQRAEEERERIRAERRAEYEARIAAIENREEYEDMMEELLDRFGEPPKMVQNLLAVASLKAMAHRIYLTEVKQRIAEERKRERRRGT